MFGRTIYLTNGKETIEIFVQGTPDMTDEEWEKRAKDMVNKMWLVKL